MKSPVSPHLVACLILGSIAPLSAQNLTGIHNPSGINSKSGADAPRFANVPVPGSYEVPDMEKVRGEVSDEPPVFTDQDAANLKERAPKVRDADSTVLDILRKPSPYRRIASGKKQPQRYEVATNSLQNGLALVSAMYREAGKAEKAADCQTIALSVKQRLNEDSSRVLEIVALEVAANPNCACEIVKTTIIATDAEPAEVVAIAEAAIHAAPESMRLISQCAIAASPESISGIQELLSRLDPNAGDRGNSAKSAKSAKGAKSAKVAGILEPPPNPLDRPPPEPPLPPISPPPVTDVNP